MPVRLVDVVVEGTLDLRGTLGVARGVLVGFENMRCRFEIGAPDASSEQIQGLKERTERYRVVMRTLGAPPPVDVEWATS